MIAPAAVRFNTGYYIFGNTYRCTMALKGYPPTTEDLALLYRLSEMSGVNIRLTARKLADGEEDAIIQASSNKNRMELGATKMKQSVVAEAALEDVRGMLLKQRNDREALKKCSQKYKIAPQDRFCNHYPPCLESWSRGERVVKMIGYDAGEVRRLEGAREHDLADKKYQKQYPLMEWGWHREDCVRTIRDAGLPLLGKSSCFFCPSMKKREIRAIYHQYPDLLERALAMEDNARPNLVTVKGLGRDFAWRDFIEFDQLQLALPDAFEPEERPCSCGVEGGDPQWQDPPSSPPKQLCS